MIPYNNYKDIKEYFNNFYYINEQGCPVEVETLEIVRSRDYNYGIIKTDDNIGIFKVLKRVKFENLNSAIQDSISHWEKRDLSELQDDYIYPYLLAQKRQEAFKKLFNKILTTILKWGFHLAFLFYLNYLNI